MSIVFLLYVVFFFMFKDMTKLVNELKDELKKKFRSMKEALERDFRTDLREINTELKSISDGTNFMNKEFEEIKLKLQSVISENAVLKKKMLNSRKKKCHDGRTTERK